MHDDTFHPARCVGCGGEFEFAAAAAGTRAACPHCGLEIELPRLPDHPDSGDAFPGPAGLDASRIASAFTGRAPRGTSTSAYQAALFAVTVLLLLLPLGYLALVGGLAVGLVAFALRWFTWVTRFLGTDQFQAIAAVAYVLGLFLGGLILFFLVKPLVAPPRRRAPAIALDPAREPLLFAFLHMVCDTVGAPHPVRVQVDCRLNATARRTSQAEATGPRGLVVTVGLPLIASLSLRQLAGVVAHEFAHFNQRAGMLSTRVLGGVNAWLERLAYGRDAWDDALETWTQGAPDWRTAVVAHTATAGVWLSRALVKVLYYIGRAVSTALLREMEREADRVQTVVAGSEDFARTCEQLALLQQTARAHYRDLRARWEITRQLPVNYPKSLVDACDAVPEDKRERIAQTQLQHEARPASTFATHPPLAERLRSAELLAAPGVFHLEGSARALFRDFDVVCERATRQHYAEVLRVPSDPTRAGEQTNQVSGMDEGSAPVP